MTADARASRLLSLVFTDLVGSTALKQERGDVEAGGIIAEHRQLVERLRQDSGGRVIDWAGDGCFLTFETPSAAVQFALAAQRGQTAAHLPRLRIGIHMGEVSETHSNGALHVEGLAVDLAARISALALPGQVLCSAAVFDSARQRLRGETFEQPIAWLAHGAYTFKGYDAPIEIAEAGFDGLSPLAPPIDVEKAYRAVAPADEETLGWRPAVGLSIPRRENWLIETRLGEGGFGEVWLAIHAKTHEKRVFKFCFEADRVRALKREVVLFRLLKESLGDRDDIAKIVDWDFDHAPYFLESEYTEGGDLRQWVERQGGASKVPMELRLNLVAQAADALAAAHSVGVLHKDIKSANILISERGSAPRAILTDFGIGLLTDPGALAARGITAAGLTETLVNPSSPDSGTGTRLYVAPEILEGRPATIQSDIYALGVVLYQMVIGDFSRTLAPGWERSIADELIREDIAACVEGEPANRLRSAAELAQRLRMVEMRREELRKSAHAARTAATARRVRRMIYAFGAIALLLSVVAAWYQMRLRDETLTRARQARLHAEEQERAREVAEAARDEARMQRENAERAQYRGILRLAETQLANRNVMRARETLHDVAEPHRDWAWGVLANRLWLEPGRDEATALRSIESDATIAQMWDQASPVVLARNSAVHARYQWQPDVNTVFAYNHGVVTLLNPGLDPIIAEFQAEDTWDRGFAASPDGRFVALNRGNTEITLWKSSTGELHHVLSGHRYWPENFRFSPDSRWLVSTSWDGTARIWDVESGAQRASIPLQQSPWAMPIGFPPDSSAVVLPTNLWSITHYALPDGGELNTVTSQTQNGDVVDLSQDLRYVLSVGAERSVSVWDALTGEILSNFNLTGNSSYFYWVPPRFSPDNSCVMAMPDERTIEIWDNFSGRLLTFFETTDGFRRAFFFDDGTIGSPEVNRGLLRLAPGDSRPHKSHQFVAHTDAVTQIRLFRDGRRFVSASYDGTAIVWDIAARRPQFTLRGHSAKVAAVHISPDETSILTIGFDGEARLWNAENGQQISLIPAGHRRPSALGGPYSKDFLWKLAQSDHIRFSPDGRRVIVPQERAHGVIANVQDGAILATLGEGTEHWIHDAEFSPRGTTILTYPWPEAEASLWHADTGQLIRQMSSDVLRGRFTPDGGAIVLAGEVLAVYEAETGVERWSHRGRIKFDALSLSADGLQVIAGDRWGGLYIHDVQTGQQLKYWSGHTEGVVHIQPSPDDTYLLSIGNSESIKVWNAKRENVLSLGSNLLFTDAAWSPAGNALFSVRFAPERSDLHEIEIWESIPWHEVKSVGGSDWDIGARISEWRKRLASEAGGQ